MFSTALGLRWGVEMFRQIISNEYAFLSVLSASVVVLAGAAVAQEHFDPKGKPPSEHTIAKQQEMRDTELR